MSSSAEDVKKHTRLYWKIGATLLVLTVVTVAASYLPSAVPLAVTIALIIALTKGSLVATYFMHLVDERKGIYATLLVTAIFFLVLLFIPLLGHADRVGEYMTLPNANAPAEHGEH